MASTVQNTDVKQKNAEHTVVVAITSHSVFESRDGDDVFGAGLAFPLLQALQRVNEQLLEGNPDESLLFDVVLVTTDRKQQQQRSLIMSSTTHHGLDVSRFCFSCEEDFVESLQTNAVDLFLSTDRKELLQASEQGVVSALLETHSASPPLEQLRILFCGDFLIQPDAGLKLAGAQSAKGFLSRLGEVRRRFSVQDSPLSITVLTSRGGRESCGSAICVLRSFGINADEAYCLAGAPRAPILNVLQPHFIFMSFDG
ncbi:cytosolic 5'-nucleotidase 1A [Gouania willdenowi]|uniref:Cytosolic 5'-nucleotidase 1A-like n=1 Tax=Gouania willdenowi TaxID=441366 RepID=A0A8C5HK73_GOUWI|nr:cytosolic 5'-nucleotidase 1A-like [Gouania willdenowi]